MRYPGEHHVLPLFGLWRWAPYMIGKFYWKKKNARSFFLDTPVNLINKSNEMLFQKVQQRYTRLINTIYFLVLSLINHEIPYNLKILCWASTHLLSQSLPFLQLQVCDLKSKNLSKTRNANFSFSVYYYYFCCCCFTLQQIKGDIFKD